MERDDERDGREAGGGVEGEDGRKKEQMKKGKVGRESRSEAVVIVVDFTRTFASSVVDETDDDDRWSANGRARETMISR